MKRRHFVQAGVAGCLLSSACFAKTPRLIEDGVADSLEGRIFKSLKIGMVKAPGSLTEKFRAAKAAGFDAIELDAPLRFTKTTIEGAQHAISESGLIVDGTVCGSHWKATHTHPDPDIRQQALGDLVKAIQQTDALGGKTVLLVAGQGKDGKPAEIEARAVENISKALPTAARHGITIAIENVWNQMHYDHDGPNTQTADRLIKFVDAFGSPLVGMQFDIGNHWKYGNMGDWIRQLGKRIVKLDLKGFSRATGKFTHIGAGDVDWADVRKALVEINFHGYAAAEVAGGGPERLQEISTNVNRVMGLTD